MSGIDIRISGADVLEADLLDASKLELVQKTVKARAAEVAQKAQSKARVDTGTLKRSIRVKSISFDGLTAVVGPNVHYAAYVELGTRFMQAQPYLGPAMEAVRDAFLADLRRLK